MGKILGAALAACAALSISPAHAREPEILMPYRPAIDYYDRGGYTPPPAPTYDSRCQSANLCSFNTMPLISQSSAEIIAGLDRYSNPENGCGVVSSLMMARALSSEKAATTQFAKLPMHANLLGGLVNLFSDGKGLPVSGPLSLDEVFKLSLAQQAKYFAAQVNYSGLIGVLPSSLRNGIERMRASAVGASTNRMEDEVGALENIQKDLNHFRSSIRRDKMAYTFLMWGLHKHTRRKYYAFGKKITYYTRNFSSAHYLAVKGFDGDSLVAHDPWGYVYKVNVSKRHSVLGHVGLGKDHTFLEPAAGTTVGYVARTHNSGGVLLGSYVGWSLK